MELRESFTTGSQFRTDKSSKERWIGSRIGRPVELVEAFRAPGIARQSLVVYS